MLTLRAASLFSLTPLALLLGGAALAQARITQALVYPGGAEVQRVTAVAAGAQEAVFACIPARYETNGFRAQGLADVRVGEIRVESLEKDAAPVCSGNAALDARIRALEDTQAGVMADRAALDLLIGYLKGAGQGEIKGGVQAATGEAIRRQGAEALKQQHQLQRRIDELEQQLKPLRLQRDAEAGDVEGWLRVSVRVQATQGGQVQLTGRTARAGWEPIYRADLDSAKGSVLVERRAEVAQSTGESWRDVKLVLSTRQPNRAMALPDPRPWLLAQAQPRPVMKAMAAPAAPAAELERVQVSGSRLMADVDASLPSFASDFDLQFTLPGSVSVASGGERRSVMLERLTWPVQLVTQVQPQAQAQAYLMASFARPEGFFPPGSAQLMRDGEFVGRTHFHVGQEAEQRLFFGPDDRLRVRVEPQQRDAGNTGFIGSRRVVAVKRAYVLENTSGKPLAVQVVEAGPQAQHEDIQVQAKLNPAPAVNAWRDLPGVRLWQLTLAPKQSQRLTADYELSAPKDMAVTGWP
jgi:uncharacterized protein (TIGR02231 family)